MEIDAVEVGARLALRGRRLASASRALACIIAVVAKDTRGIQRECPALTGLSSPIFVAMFDIHGILAWFRRSSPPARTWVLYLGAATSDWSCAERARGLAARYLVILDSHIVALRAAVA